MGNGEEGFFAFDSRSRILSLRQKRKLLNKGYKSMSEYICEVTSIVDAFAVASDKTSDSDVVLYELGGRLEDDFESL